MISYEEFLNKLNKKVEKNQVERGVGADVTYKEILDTMNKKMQENGNYGNLSSTNRVSTKGQAYVAPTTLNNVPTRKKYTAEESANNVSNVNLPVSNEFKQQLLIGKRVQVPESYSKPVSATEFIQKMGAYGLKTLGATIGDVAFNVVEGAGQMSEGIADKVSYTIANIAEATGNKAYADRLRKVTQVNNWAETTKDVNNALDKYSLIDETGDQIFQGVGQGIINIGTSLVPGGKFLMPVTTYTSSSGGATTEALSEGATQEEAEMYGRISGLGETLTEYISGGLSKIGNKIGIGKGIGEIDDKIATALTKKINSSLAKNLTQMGVKASGEGLEEVLSGFINAIGKKLTYKSEEDLKKLIDDENLLQQFIVGTISSSLLQSPEVAIATKNNVDYVNLPISQNGRIEQNSQQIQQINQGQNKMAQNGNMEQMPIRNYQYVETDNGKINNLRKDMSKYWTDSNETKALGSVIEKVISDKGYNIRLDNTIISNNGNPVNAKITTLKNGEVEIRINPNSKNVGEFLLMHETTHAIETQEMKNLVMDYASKNAEFNNALESLKQTYGVQDVSNEVLADVSGKLFGNQEFINNLSLEKPNVFKRIYNKIIELANKITGNSHEALFIRDLKNKWQEAYRTQSNNLNNGVQYHVSENLGTNIDKVLKGEYQSSEDVRLRDFTPKILVENGIKDLPMLINQNHLKENILSKTKASKMGILNKDANYHNLGKDTFIKAIDNLDNPLMIMKSISKNGKNTYVVVTDVQNKNGEQIIVPVYLEGKGNYNNIEIDTNKVKSVYGKDNIKKLVDNTIKGDINNIIYMTNDKNKRQLITTTGLQLSNYSKTASKNSILPTQQDVNSTTKYSMQESENNSGSFNLDNKKWQEHLDENYKATGTKTNLEDIKLPTKEYFENSKTQKILSDEDLNVLNKIYEKEGKTEILTEKKKASLLDKYISDKYKFKDSIDMLAQKVVNKGHYVDKLAESSGNLELKYMYDRNLNSFAEAQYTIGVAQTDNNGNAIGKSINDIWKPVEDSNLTKEFSEYMLHKLNVDRGEKNKYVFGEDIKPADSTRIALDLEAKHPEFKEYAEDIKNFNHNNLMNLKDAGLVSQETIDYLEAMYPNYVPISRAVEEKLYTGSTEETGTMAPIKKAVGGNSDIQPLKDSMAEQAIRMKKLINENHLGQELAKSLKNAKVEDVVDITVTPAVLMETDTLVETDGSGNKFYTYFEDGKLQKLKINDELYESLRPTEISKIERTLPFKGIQKATNINRSLLTSSNPLFVVTNFFKDLQDGMFNSKYSSKFIKNYGKALNEIITHGKYYESYMANGGMTNSYFDYESGVKRKSNKFVEKIRSANEIVEQLPRLTEFISTLETGKGLNEAMYNAAEITTNFKRGGEWTKTLNRNGATFLNASIQGFDKFYRNFSGQNGAKGYANLALKATLLGVAPAILNHMLLGDDDDYQKLSQSEKDLYYLFKYDDGKFIRIPKGRTLSIFGAIGRRTVEGVQGQDDAWSGFGNTVVNQIAPNNPMEDNILAPITAVANNKTWYGSDLVSSRLQKELPKNQYDETTDEFSKWLGNTLNISPKKINYLIDQYSGGIGDVLLPMITPQAKENVVIDKFTTDSVLKNKNVSKFYETLEKQNQIVNDSFSTDKDRLELKYLNDISSEMSKLYKEKREVQMSNISQEAKRKKVREIQSKIDAFAEDALNNYRDVEVNGNTATTKYTSYFKNGKGQWEELTDTEKEKNKNISLKTFADYKNKLYDVKQDKIKSGELSKTQDLKTKDKIQVLLDSNYSDKEISALYENYILSSTNKTYSLIKESGIDIKEYLKYEQQDFKSDVKDDGTVKGKTVSNSKKTKEYDYVNNMNISYNQKLLILGLSYKLNNAERSKLANYINGFNLNKTKKLEAFSKIKGFTVYKDGRVKW